MLLICSLSYCVFIIINATGTGQSIAATTLVASSALNLGKSISSIATGTFVANTPSGRALFSPTDSQVTIFNSLVNSNSIIVATVASNDTSLKNVWVEQSTGGQFVLYPNALATANTKVNWMVTN